MAIENILPNAAQMDRVAAAFEKIVESADSAAENMKTIRDNAEALQGVNANLEALKDVHDNMSDVKAVSGGMNVVQSVSGGMDDIKAVADGIEAVQSVAGDLETVQTAMENLQDIKAAVGAAEQAEAAKTAAESARDKAEGYSTTAGEKAAAAQTAQEAAEAAATRAEAVPKTVEDAVRSELQELVDTAQTAKSDAQSAKDAAEAAASTAEGHSTTAGEKATEAQTAQAAADESAKRAEAAAKQAEQIAGGDFATRDDVEQAKTEANTYTDDAIKGVKIQMDDTPAVDSENPVKSSGIYTALAAKADKTELQGIKVDASNVTFEDGQSFQDKLDAGNLTGPKGADGAPGKDGQPGAAGPVGPAGPNTVSTATATDIKGLLKGNGETVEQAAAGVDYATAEQVNAKADAADLDAKQDKLAFDDTPKANSNNPVKSGGIHTALAAKADSAAMTSALAAKANTTDMNTALSKKADTATMNTELGKKQNTLTFDSAPVADSSNPVKSGGVFTALSAKANASDLTAHTGKLSGNPHKVTAAEVGALPLAGGTLTGNLTLSGDETHIWSKTSTRTPSGRNCGITFINGDANGAGILIGAGGRTIIGGGEAAGALCGALTSSNASEELDLGADGTVYIHSNCNTIANRKTFTFNNAGALVVPVGTDYTTAKARNIAAGTSKPASLDNGQIFLVYDTAAADEESPDTEVIPATPDHSIDVSGASRPDSTEADSDAPHRGVLTLDVAQTVDVEKASDTEDTSASTEEASE